jgi:hypothetical protein
MRSEPITAEQAPRARQEPEAGLIERTATDELSNEDLEAAAGGVLAVFAPPDD